MELARRIRSAFARRPGTAERKGHGPFPADDEGGAPYAVQPARAWAQLTIRGALWGAIAVGFLGGTVALLRPASTGAEPVADPDAGTVPTTVANLAELAVEAWLTADGRSDQLDSLFVEPPEPPLAPQDRDVQVERVVTQVVALGGKRLETGYWEVMVAADVTEAVTAVDGSDDSGGPDGSDDSGGSDSSDSSDSSEDSDGSDGSAPVPAGGEPDEDGPARWYLEVGVIGDSRGALLAVGAPALVPAPALSVEDLPLPELAEPETTDDPLTAKLQSFFDAYLTGRGNLSDHLDQDMRDAQPVQPAPFAGVVVERYAVTELEDSSIRVRAELSATTAAGMTQTVAYEVRLTPAAGRWEVLTITGAPTMEDEIEMDRGTTGSVPASTSLPPPSTAPSAGSPSTEPGDAPATSPATTADAGASTSTTFADAPGM